VPVCVLSSRVGWGTAFRRVRLFATPEERAPAAVLRAYARAVAGSSGAVAERPRPALGALQLAPGSADAD